MGYTGTVTLHSHGWLLPRRLYLLERDGVKHTIGWMGTPQVLLAALGLLVLVAVHVALIVIPIARIPKEYKIMRNEFEAEWNTWIRPMSALNTHREQTLSAELFQYCTYDSISHIRAFYIKAQYMTPFHHP